MQIKTETDFPLMIDPWISDIKREICCIISVSESTLAACVIHMRHRMFSRAQMRARDRVFQSHVSPFGMPEESETPSGFEVTPYISYRMGLEDDLEVSSKSHTSLQ